MKENKLKDIAKITMGISPKSNSFNSIGLGLPFLQGRTNFGDKYPSHELWTSSWKREANKGDILFSVRAPVGDINISKEKIAIGRGLASIKPINVSTEYLYYLLLTNKQKFLTSSCGTIFDSINKDSLENVELIIHSSYKQQHIVNIRGAKYEY